MQKVFPMTSVLFSLCALSCVQSKNQPTSDLGVIYRIFSGQIDVSVCRNDSPPLNWLRLNDQSNVVCRQQGESGFTTIQVQLGNSDVLEWFGGTTTHISKRKDVFYLTHDGESFNLNEELEVDEYGQLVGTLEGEKTGDFTLSLVRKNNDDAPNSVVTLTTPVLYSHTDGGDVYESDGLLIFEFPELSPPASIYDLGVGQLFIQCPEDQRPMGLMGEEPWFGVGLNYDRDVAETDGLFQFDLPELYSAVTLEETSQCTMRLNHRASGTADPMLKSYSSISASQATEFSATFHVE